MGCVVCGWLVNWCGVSDVGVCKCVSCRLFCWAAPGALHSGSLRRLAQHRANLRRSCFFVCAPPSCVCPQVEQELSQMPPGGSEQELLALRQVQVRKTVRGCGGMPCYAVVS